MSEKSTLTPPPPPPPSVDADRTPTVNEVADEIIHGDRAKMYGHPKINFKRIAMGWNAYLHARPSTDEQPLDEHDVAEMMIILKAVRGSQGYHRDSAVDTIGYAALDAILAGDDPY